MPPQEQITLDSTIELLVSLTQLEWHLLGIFYCWQHGGSKPLERFVRGSESFFKEGFVEDGDLEWACDRLRERASFDLDKDYYATWGYVRTLFRVLLVDASSQEMRADVLSLVEEVNSIPSAWKPEFHALSASIGGIDEAFEAIRLVGH